MEETERTIMLTMPYDSEEQLRTVLYFLQPVLVSYTVEEKKGARTAYIIVAV